MADIREATIAAIVSSIKYSPDNLRTFIAEKGSIRAAGRAAGIGESTLRGWLKGSNPRNTGTINSALRDSDAVFTKQMERVKGVTITATGEINLTDGKTTDVRGNRTVSHTVLDENKAQKIVLRAVQGFNYEALAEWASDFPGNSYYPTQSIEDCDCVVDLEF